VWLSIGEVPDTLTSSLFGFISVLRFLPCVPIAIWDCGSPLHSPPRVIVLSGMSPIMVETAHRCIDIRWSAFVMWRRAAAFGGSILRRNRPSVGRRPYLPLAGRPSKLHLSTRLGLRLSEYSFRLPVTSVYVRPTTERRCWSRLRRARPPFRWANETWTISCRAYTPNRSGPAVARSLGRRQWDGSSAQGQTRRRGIISAPIRLTVCDMAIAAWTANTRTSFLAGRGLTRLLKVLRTGSDARWNVMLWQVNQSIKNPSHTAWLRLSQRHAHYHTLPGYQPGSMGLPWPTQTRQSRPAPSNC
jgi:hypothetical protein